MKLKNIIVTAGLFISFQASASCGQALSQQSSALNVLSQALNSGNQAAISSAQQNMQVANMRVARQCHQF